MNVVGLAVVSSVLGSAVLSAHPITYQGTVMVVEPSRLQAKTIDEKTRKEKSAWFVVDKNTKIRRGDMTVTYEAARITAGERIVLIVDGDADTRNLLEEIRLAPAQVAGKAKDEDDSIALTTKPSPPVAGANDFMVTLKDAGGRPLTGADVSVTLTMPAMPSMNMAAMKNTVALTPASTKAEDAGKYSGKGQVMMAGEWTVLVTAKINGKIVAEKTVTLRAR